MAVVPEIHQKNDAQVKHDIVHHGETLCHDAHREERNRGDHREVSAESVDTVGCIGKIDRYPYKNGCQEDIKRLRDLDCGLQNENVDLERKQERRQCTGSNGDENVCQSFFTGRPIRFWSASLHFALPLKSL